MNTKTPFLLCILDGFGETNTAEGNAVLGAKTPCIDSLYAKFPHSQLRTDGEYVGLPEGQMGNSEVGHMTIGSGRIILQSLDRIRKDLASGSFNDLPAYQKFVNQSANSRAIHVLGMLSDGGVHSHTEHALMICQNLNSLGKPIFVHGITDGRDTAKRAALEQIPAFEKALEALENVHLATLNGRFYGMDRDSRWERQEPAHALYTELKGTHFDTASNALEATYATDDYDEFVPPAVLKLPAGLDARIQDGDSVLLFNFRADRMRQTTRCLIGHEVGFDIKVQPKLNAVATMTEYDATFNDDVLVLYPAETYENIMGDTLAKNGKTQLRISETEKYAHVTYYLNCGREEPYVGEDRILVPSPRDVKSYDMKPEMSLPEVTEKLVDAIKSQKYDFIALNVANGDQVGHCGDYEASVQAVEHIDNAMQKICDALESVNGEALIIADHGNCEEMIINGRPSTSHSTNPVPCIYFGPRKITLQNGGLADVTPTILSLMNINIPEEMEGQCLAKPV